MVNKYNEHVSKRNNDMWAVKHETGKRASRLFFNKNNAIKYARMTAKKHNACFILHENGRFKEIECKNEIPSESQISNYFESQIMVPRMAQI